MTEETLRDFLDTEVEIARKMFAKQGHVNLMFVGQNAQGERLPIQAITYNDYDKDRAAMMVRKAFLDFQAVRYAVISEAWLLVLKEGTPTPETRPSKHPDRIEAVMVQAADRTPIGVSAQMRIIRTGNTAILSAPVINEGPSQGRFTNLLGTTQ